MLLNQIKDEIETLEGLEFKKVSKEQREMLKDKHNFRTMGFEYAEDDWGNVVFLLARDTFRNMEYYLGLEYDRELIEFKIEFNNSVIVSYSGSDRAENLLVQLDKVEKQNSI